MKTYVFLLSALLLSYNLVGQGALITGNTNVSPGSIENYNVTWDSWNSEYENYANVNWIITGGSILSSDDHSVTIQWNNLEGLLNFNARINVNEDLGGQSTEFNVIIINNSESVPSFCNGIIGPKVVSIDFGSGSNPGLPLGLGITTYSYNQSCTISPGQYTIVNNSISCRQNWHNIAQDHTPNDIDGYFLMVDANSKRDEFYRTTVTGLASSIKYEFSAWVGSLTSLGESPRIRFELYDINGNIIASSGSIVVPYESQFQWQQVGFLFDLPAGITSVQVVIVNTNTASVGNDLVLDDISFAPCYPPIIASFSNSIILDRTFTCNNGTIDLYGSWPLSTIPFQNPSFQWQRSIDNGLNWINIAGGVSLTHSITEPNSGIISYRIFAFETSNSALSVISNIITYHIQEMVVDAKNTNVFACEPTSQLTGSYRLKFSDPSIQQAFTFSWTPSIYLSSTNSNSIYITLPTQPTPNASLPAPPPIIYNYTLTVTNTTYGCIGSNTQTVTQYNPRKVGVPNAFTPNGDGINDVFRPINIEDYPGSKFSIYNRWGSRIFYSEGPSLASYTWDGTDNGQMQPQEVYHWYVQLSGCKTNIFSSGGNGVSSGDLTLLR